MFELSSRGSFSKTDAFFDAIRRRQSIDSKLEELAKMGVRFLSSATPRDSGLTADSWYYTISREGRSVTIQWRNSDVVADTPVAILLQYGHGTGTGGYVLGRDFINPAIKPVMDLIAQEVWKAVTS